MRSRSMASGAGRSIGSIARSAARGTPRAGSASRAGSPSPSRSSRIFDSYPATARERLGEGGAAYVLFPLRDAAIERKARGPEIPFGSGIPAGPQHGVRCGGPAADRWDGVEERGHVESLSSAFFDLIPRVSRDV